MGGPENGVDLEEVIMKRKEERKAMAESKRRDDLQLIRQNTTTQDGLCPTELLPREIWDQIFKDLPPNDLENVWKLHGIFRDLLQIRRIRDILFPQVLKIDYLKYHLRSEDGRRSHYERMRRISKSARDAIDQWFGNKLISAIPEMQGHSPRRSAHFFFNLETHRRQLKRMLAGFQGNNNPAKRFFTRSLDIHFNDIRGVAWNVEADVQRVQTAFLEFKNDITSLLRIIGDQVWRFSFIVSDSPMLQRTGLSLSELYTILHSWILLMPNLKWMEFGSCLQIVAEEDDASRQQFSLSPNVLKTHQFPHLNSLEKITFFVFRDQKETFEIHEAILAANQHIQVLDLHGGNVHLMWLLASDLIRSLHLTRISINSEFQSDTHLSFEAIQHFINRRWPLRAISLYLIDTTDFTINSVFRFLEKFPNLEKVTLLPLLNVKIGEKNDEDNSFLMLPNLTDFNISVIPEIDYSKNISFFFSLHFLLKCKKLKTLVWNLGNINRAKLRRYLVRQECHEKMLNFRAGFRVLLHSNIWDVFPWLETIEIDICKNVRNYVRTCNQEYSRSDLHEEMSVSQFLAMHRAKCGSHCAISTG